MHRNYAHPTFVIQQQISEPGSANPYRIRHDGLEHRCQIARRTADDAQDFGSRGLLLQRLAELARARLHFIEQPHVLDGNHRLVGEGGDQFDLLVGERPHLGACQCQNADRNAFAHHRNPEDGAITAQLLCLCPSVLRVGQNIGDVDGCAFEHGSSYDRAAGQLDGMIFHIFVEGRRVVVQSSVLIARALLTGDRPHIRLAQAGCRFDERIEDCPQIEGRAADDLEHVGGGGLLLQRLAQLVEQPGVLDGDDGLVGEIGEQRDLFVREGTNFLTINRDCPNQLIILEHRHNHVGPNATKFDAGDSHRVAFSVSPCRCEVAVDRLLGANRLGVWNVLEILFE